MRLDGFGKPIHGVDHGVLDFRPFRFTVAETPFAQDETYPTRSLLVETFPRQRVTESLLDFGLAGVEAIKDKVTGTQLPSSCLSLVS